MATVPTIATITVGQKVTAAYLNTIRDAVAFLTGPPECVLTSTLAQSPASGAWTPVLFDTEGIDSDAVHSTSVSTSRMTIVTPGWYRAAASNLFATNATGARLGAFWVNGVTQMATIGVGAISGTQTCISTGVDVYLNVGDYIEFQVWQNSGVALALTGCRFSLKWERS